MNAKAAAPRGRPAPWLYLFSVLAWTWTCHGIIAFTDQRIFDFPAVLLALLGALGPSAVAGILVAAGRWDPALDESVGGFFRRAFDPRALPWRWHLIILSLILILALTPVLLDASVLRQLGLFERGPTLFLFIGFVFGALEEPGWRGYAQEGLQRSMSVLAASLIVGVFWAAWHLPLFFISGTYQAGLGAGTAAFWTFQLAILVGCPTYAWLYNATDRTTLAAVLYHGASNVVRELVPDVSNVAEVGVEAALALVITCLSWGLMRRRRPGPEEPSPGIADSVTATAGAP